MTETQRQHRYPQPPLPSSLGLPVPDPGRRRSGADLPKLKKFRFQLLADWIIDHFPPERVADVGGGKGLLAYMLEQEGFDATVIDPVDQSLPDKYKNLRDNTRVRIPVSATVSRVNAPYTEELGKDFDLLVALHTHGSNVAIIETCARYPVTAIILPCCVIDEPHAPAVGDNWFMWLVNLARKRGLTPEFFTLNFSGQNIGMVIKGPAEGPLSEHESGTE
jgi:hypothetical protein